MTINSIQKIISGGQTGVDRAALDIALALNIPHGGWCPKGRKAEDGIIPAEYLLQETSSADYAERTAFNVRDSDGTLILLKGEPIGGTLLTIELALKLIKPCFIINLAEPLKTAEFCSWIKNNYIQTLNIAGPRASQVPDIYQLAYSTLQQLLAK